MNLTVFTPTYNRGYTIHNLYNSLLRQTFHNFEWIIVDDGSTDNTEFLVKQWIKEKKLEIKYCKQENGGKHRAINKGIKMAKGEMFFIVDSDDFLSINALERIVFWKKTIENNSNFAGVVGLRAYPNGKIIGDTFKEKFIDCTSLESKKYNIIGDKAEVFYTSILKRHLFPEFDEENFLTECVVWNRIANEGKKLRYFNEKIYFCEYLEDGLTKSCTEKKFLNNFQGYSLYTKENIRYSEISIANRMRNLGYFTILAKKKNWTFKRMSNEISVCPFFLLFIHIAAKAYLKYKSYEDER